MKRIPKEIFFGLVVVLLAFTVLVQGFRVANAVTCCGITTCGYCGPNWDACGCNPGCTGCCCSCCDCCCGGGGGDDDDDDTGPVCGNGLCEIGETEYGCCLDCGTPCDGTGYRIRGSSTLGCGSCPGGSCFCDASTSPYFPGVLTYTRGGCNSKIFAILFPDGTTMMASYAELEELEQSEQEFEVIERPVLWESSSIVCPVLAADGTNTLPIDGSVQTGSSTNDIAPETIYASSGSFGTDIFDPSFHVAFLRFWMSVIAKYVSVLFYPVLLVVSVLIFVLSRKFTVWFKQRGRI